MERIYQTIINDHLAQYRQMIFLSGPRQTGKTTLSKNCVKQHYPYLYLNWDDIDDRAKILGGITHIVQELQLDILKDTETLPVIIFDEVHKYKKWKSLLKGYFDKSEDQLKMIITGSAKLNIFRKTGDSLMGRYFLYHIHPFTVAEIMGRKDLTKEIVAPTQIPSDIWQKFLNFGGFPEPFTRGTKQFYQRWKKLKHDQFFYEDLRDLSKITDISQIELLAHLLRYQIGSTSKYSELAKKVRVSEPTVRSWTSLLEELYYCFSIRPWSRNISRSLIKEPKIYLWDWSLIDDLGAKIENLVACHLLKAVHLWTDIGLGNYQLHYLRDKDKREVDFLVTQNGKPWLMVEVKNSDNQHLNPNLLFFNTQLKTPHVLQVCHNMKYIDKDCFSLHKPMIVPLLTFLSQLV